MKGDEDFYRINIGKLELSVFIVPTSLHAILVKLFVLIASMQKYNHEDIVMFIKPH